MRCFLAVPLPDDLRGQVAALCRSLAPRLPSARFVPAAQMHLTLHFFPDLDAGGVAGAAAAAAEACAAVPSFPAALGGLGAFPDARRARVLWAGLARGAGELVALQDAVSRALHARGLPVDDRPYRPHLTLARFRLPDPGVPAALAAQAAFATPAFPVAETVLFESRLGPAGALHTALQRFPLSPVP